LFARWIIFSLSGENKVLDSHAANAAPSDNVVAGKSDINTALREAEESANQKISTLGK
jgi:hypothetical protein